MNRAFAFHPVTFIFCFLAIILLYSRNHRINGENQDTPATSADTHGHVQRVLRQSQEEIVFLENVGQIKDTKGLRNPDILFLTRSEGVDMYITRTGITYVFRNEVSNADKPLQSFNWKLADAQTNQNFYRLDMEFMGMNKDVSIKKELTVDNKYHYFTPE